MEEWQTPTEVKIVQWAVFFLFSGTLILSLCPFIFCFSFGLSNTLTFRASTTFHSGDGLTGWEKGWGKQRFYLEDHFSIRKKTSRVKVLTFSSF